jgi:tetratricopeptide (TPR) repeat protein
MIINRRVSRVLFLLLASAIFDGCSQYVETHVSRGDAYFSRSNYGEAIEEYTKASRLRTDDPHIIRQLGLAHKALGHRLDAYAFLQKARELDPADTVVRVVLASMFLADGGGAQAINEASAVLRNAPNNLEALNLLGSAFLAKGDAGKALETFRKIHDLSPRDARAQYLIGLALLAQKNIGEATESLEAALRLSPSFVDPLAQLIQIDLAGKHPDAAVTRVQRQIAIVGDSAKLHELLGTVYLARGNRQRADAAFRKAIALSPHSAESLARLSDLDLAAGKYEQALAIADSSLRLDPRNLTARLSQGVAYEQKGDRQHAKQAYEAALAVNPRYADAANNLAMLLIDEDSTSRRALELAEMAKAASPDDPRISDTLGWVLFKLGDYQRAVALFTQAAARMPDEPTVAYHLGIARLKAGNPSGARDALTRALHSRTSFPERAAAQKALASLS